MPSKHINAKAGDFADTVIMPGDPLRAKYIAEKYLDNVTQVNDVRSMYGFYRRIQKSKALRDGAWHGYSLGVDLCNRTD